MRKWLIGAMWSMLGLLVGGAGLVQSTQPAGPDVLAWLPGDMVGFVHVKGDALWNHPGIRAALSKLPPTRAREFIEPLETVKRALGVELSSVKTATGYIRKVNIRSQEISFGTVLTSDKPFDKQAVMAALVSGRPGRFESETYQSVELIQLGVRGDDMFVIALPEPTVLLFGEIAGVRALLDGRARAGQAGPLTAAVREAGKHDLTLAVKVPDEVRSLFKMWMDREMGMGRAAQPTFQVADVALTDPDAMFKSVQPPGKRVTTAVAPPTRLGTSAESSRSPGKTVYSTRVSTGPERVIGTRAVPAKDLPPRFEKHEVQFEARPPDVAYQPRMRFEDDMGRTMARMMGEMFLDVDQFRLHVDIRPDLQISLELTARTEQQAKRLLRAGHAFILAGEMASSAFANVLERQRPRELPAEILPLAKRVAESVSASKLTHQGTQVRFEMQVADFDSAITAILSSSVGRVMLARDRMMRQSNLRQMVIAMHNYHTDYMKMPANASYTRTAPKQPLLSWRVHLLPYLEHDNLYKQFKLDEPWDSEHNKQFIAKMPAIFSSPGAPNPGQGKTYYQVFVGPERPPAGKGEIFVPIFQLGGRQRSLGQITVQDGTSNTLCIAEATNAVIWTKPEDLFIEHDEAPLPKLGCVPEEDTFSAAFCDGSVRTIKRSLRDSKQYDALLRQLIGVRDGRNDDTSPIVE